VCHASLTNVWLLEGKQWSTDIRSVYNYQLDQLSHCYYYYYHYVYCEAGLVGTATLFVAIALGIMFIMLRLSRQYAHLDSSSDHQRCTLSAADDVSMNTSQGTCTVNHSAVNLTVNPVDLLLQHQVILIIFTLFSQTWLRYVWLMAWQIRLSVCLSCVTCVHPTHGVQLFWDIFALYCSLVIRQLTHRKSRRSSKGITPERVKQEGLVKQANLPYRRQYLVTYLLYSLRINK